MKSDNLREFLWWMTERQEIYRRRHVQEEDPPWTDDEVLRKYHFCNVYRELDRATRYLSEHVLSETDNRDVFFNVVFFRLLNRPESHVTAGGMTPVDDFHAPTVVEQLQEFNEENAIFSPAYRVSTHKYADCDSKVENIVYGVLRDDVQENIDDYLWNLLHAEFAQEAFDVLTEIRGVGDFLAYELLTDLNYRLLPFDENQFVNIGPGAAKGLELIFEDASERHVWWLMENQEWLFEKFGLDFYRWNGEEAKRLTLRDIEHSLCEYQKYRRVMEGGGNVRRFDPFGGEQVEIDEFVGR